MGGDNVGVKINRITFLGAATNILLSIIKIVAGLLFGSMAVVVDGIHSISDLITDAAVVVGFRLSEKAPDKNHPYGHKWYESFATALISILLVATGIVTIYKTPEKAGNITGVSQFAALIATAVISIGAKEFLFRKTREVAYQTKCSSLYANAWHHRSDALSSLAVLGGLGAQAAGFIHGDRVAAVIVAAMIIFAGIRLFSDVLKVFTDASVDNKTLSLVEDIVNSNSDIKQMHKLRSRSVGREIFLDFHILVDSELNVLEAHKISMDVERQIQEVLDVPVNIIVHIEPDKPWFHK